jgi:ABC-type uncharacterized transport system permease subunit
VQAVPLIALLAGLAHLAAGIGLALGYFHSRPAWRNIAVALAVAGAFGHAMVVWARMVTPLGLDANFINMLGLAALMTVVVLLISSLRSRMLEAGIVVFPGAAVCLWLMWLVQPSPLVLTQAGTMLEIHVFSSLLAWSLLSIAAISALMLATQDYLLRHPRPIRQLEFLPPLTVLETLMFRLIAGGWLVLTLSLLTGLMFIDNLLAQHLVHKTVLSLASWILFGLLLGGRWWFGWRGRRAVNWTLMAMLLLALAYFGSKLVLEVILERTWTGSPAVVISLPLNG